MEAVLKRKVWEDPLLLAAALSDFSDKKPPPLCPISGNACDSDFSHLCEDWDCVRKGSLSAVMRGH
jgi:hypothetical protein